jgi:hypothetical protein
MTLWLLIHGYHGLTGDGQIYAFQALARLHPHLAADLYLQNTSQDRFTLFSPFYAFCIGLVGLETAARSLTLLFTVSLLAATWSFARTVSSREAAWAAVAFLLIIPGTYGGSGVFRLLDPFLTARLPAQALIVTAFYCQVSGMKRLGLSLALTALLIHPLMALPGLLLIVCLWLPLRMGGIGAIAGVFAALALSAAAVILPAVSHVLPVMDAPWFDVVRERSQFLFLQLWSRHDWEINVQPFVYLGFTAIAVPEERVRKLCAASALVGAAGLGVALIGNLIGPNAVLIQGQAWRWMWVTLFVSLVLLPFTALRVGQDERCGPLCALLLVLGWMLPESAGTTCVGLALIFWLSRPLLTSRSAALLRWLSLALGIAIGVWILVECRAIIAPLGHQSGRSALETQIQGIFVQKSLPLLIAVLIGWRLRVSRTRWTPIILSAVLAGFCIFMFPAAFRQSRALAVNAQVREFADWTNVIPPTSTVLVVPSRDVGTFVWFTLDRPNYLTLDQSAGVVFSRATALEVRRRSEVLLPLMPPDWMILTRLRSKSGSGPDDQATTHPLTSESLRQVCVDPALGFVISREKIAFDHFTHAHAGPWKDWNLYDCSKVRLTRPVR